MAKRYGLALKLVHVVDVRVSGGVTGLIAESDLTALRAAVEQQARDLSGTFAIDVEAVVKTGFAPDVIVATARENQAQLIVVGAVGEHAMRRWLLGSVAERLAQISPIPVLVVRRPRPLQDWALGRNHLRVVVGIEPLITSRSVIDWVKDLDSRGDCGVTYVQVVSPLHEHNRLELGPPAPLDHLREDVAAALMKSLRDWVGNADQRADSAFRVQDTWGRIDAQLSLFAANANADLLVVGTRQRVGMAALWQTSVARGVLHLSDSNVVCIPHLWRHTTDVPAFGHVLVGTDFSPLADHAIPYAYGLVRPGGTVHLLHVANDAAGSDDASVRQQLMSLVPAMASHKNITTICHVIREQNPYAAICELSGQLAVDAICMGTHGRSGLTGSLLGSQAQLVVEKATRPVLLVPARKPA